MITNPTNEPREQAREIARFFFHGDPLPTIGGRVWASAQSSPEAALADYIAEALSSRDAEIRKVLEGLATYRNPICWCPPNTEAEPHTEACRATTVLYAKFQKKENDVAVEKD